MKLLDAGERLPVHYHPGRPFAKEHLGLRYGKTESWLILEADPGAAVHVGLKEPLDAETARRWVDEQDADAMLPPSTSVPVQAGDGILVPAGTLHAIGGGILLLELQEPTDLSVLVEWKKFGVDDGTEHLELGWETALESLDREPIDPAALTEPTGGGMLPKEADPYFRAERIEAGDTLEPELLDRARDRRRGHDRRACRCGAAARCWCPTPPATTETEGVEGIRCLPPDPAPGTEPGDPGAPNGSHRVRGARVDLDRAAVVVGDRPRGGVGIVVPASHPFSASQKIVRPMAKPMKPSTVGGLAEPVRDRRLVGAGAEHDTADVVAPAGAGGVGHEPVVLGRVEALDLPDVGLDTGGLQLGDRRSGEPRAQLGA